MSFKYLIHSMLVTFVSSTLFSQPCPLHSCNTRTKFNFRLIEKEGIQLDTTVVKVSGVYISPWEVTDLEGKRVKQYYFIRFFNNCRVYFSCAYCSFPTIAELNNLSYGSYGYYSVTGNEVKMETFAPYAGYYFNYALVNGDTLTSNGTSQRKWKGEIKRQNPAIKHSWSFYPCILSSASFW